MNREFASASTTHSFTIHCLTPPALHRREARYTARPLSDHQLDRRGRKGEVYRARDTRPNRDVAVKTLPELFAADPDRVARFEREAQTLAALNHPNIANVYGVEDRALVMELVEGQDLAMRIARGPMPLDEAIAIGRHVVEGLVSLGGQRFGRCTRIGVPNASITNPALRGFGCPIARPPN